MTVGKPRLLARHLIRTTAQKLFKNEDDKEEHTYAHHG